MTTFRAPEKAILSKEQLAAFQSSNTYAKITSYIEVLNNAVVGCKLTDECSQSQVRWGPLWHLRFSFRLFHRADCLPVRGVFARIIKGVAALIEVLDRVEALAGETPPVDNAASRFGNPAFKTFYDKVQQARERWGFCPYDFSEDQER
jgi:serine/threonine-protein phosphatase 2A activator